MAFRRCAPGTRVRPRQNRGRGAGQAQKLIVEKTEHHAVSAKRSGSPAVGNSSIAQQVIHSDNRKKVGMYGINGDNRTLMSHCYSWCNGLPYQVSKSSKAII